MWRINVAAVKKTYRSDETKLWLELCTGYIWEQVPLELQGMEKFEVPSDKGVGCTTFTAS